MKGKIVRCAYHGVKHIWHCIVFILSPSFFKTLYFNFHYLPFFKPIILKKVRFVSLKGEVIIQSDKIKTGMIRTGEWVGITGVRILFPNLILEEGA